MIKNNQDFLNQSIDTIIAKRMNNTADIRSNRDETINADSTQASDMIQKLSKDLYYEIDQIDKQMQRLRSRIDNNYQGDENSISMP